MAAIFSVQTDAGTVVDANAYITLAYFKQYHDNRGRTYPADPAVQLGIVRATDYVDMRWRKRFAGTKGATDALSATQTTEFPRQLITDDLGNDILGIPEVMKKAVAEYALRAATTELLVDPV